MKSKILIIASVLAGLALWVLCALLFEHGMAHFFGVDTQQSQNYDFVSGVGPMIITALGYLGIVSTLLHHFNCHVTGCWNVGRFTVADGQYKVCRSHHPDKLVRLGKLTHTHIMQAHNRSRRPSS